MRPGCWRPATTDRPYVRPASTGARLNDLLAARLDAPHRFHLEDNLHCPNRIAVVIERASEWYVHLDKARRPTKQRHQHGAQHVDAHLFHVAADVPAAAGLLEWLDDVEGVVVLTVGDELPAWVPERLRDMVLTPPTRRDSSTSRSASWIRNGCWRAWTPRPGR